MKKILYLTLGCIFLFINILSAQEKQSFENKVSIIKVRIEKITTDERTKLKKAIKEINRQLNENEITATEAQKLKENAAKNSALAIKNKVAVEEQQLHNLVQNKVDKTYYKEENSKRFSIGGFDIDYSNNYNRRHYKKNRRRTSSSLVFAVGLNNLVTNDAISSVNNSDYNFWSSHYLEIGSNNKTSVFKSGGLFYLNYGLSVVYTSLHPKNNQFFVVDKNLNKTFLQTNNLNLDKSKFKNIQLIFPLYLELNFSKPYINNDKVVFRPNKGFKIGLGGFIGLNLKTKQILKYTINDIKTKDIKKGDFNVNNFLYGINSFVGIDDTSLFIRYNLNQLFNNSNLNQKNIAFGLLFNW